MKTLLQHQKSRRIFLLLIAVLLIAIFLLRSFVLINFHAQTLNGVTTEEPMWHALATRLLDSIFVSLFVTVFIGIFMFYIEVPDEDKKFDIVESLRLGELFDRSLSQTDSWHFSGGMGRHTRAKTIPYFHKGSKSSNQQKTIKIQLIDPADVELCQTYANYRKSLRSAQGSEHAWTANFVRRELLTTIIIAVVYRSMNQLLDIEVRLKNSFSTLRIDMSSSVAIITKEDKNEPAIVCRDGSFLYKAYKEELVQSYKSQQPLKLSNFDLDISSLSETTVERILIDLNLNNGLSSTDYKAICKTIKDNKNPYA
ncbi:hypothetical protein [Mucilaginibacter jinjuensis]|uniref:Uncharacterized protein n=1 Tax=Mucilaginibacter jinjuensis TaxID=1176721 RepID=A0ABY7T5A2_9SPHI|nr:hypothetical protein [Mucilaginibacter jinjuensis]WCT11552.1 hypothetical protein PQO05_22695 [Mucilaginibacter jinjuensis]